MRLQRRDTGFTSTELAILCIWALGAVASIAVTGGVVYLVFHFAKKFW